MADFAALASRLIAKNGRDVTLKAFTTTAADAAKPWRGGATAVSGATPTVKAVFVEPSDVKLGSHQDNQGVVSMADKVAFIAAENNIEGYAKIADGGVDWTIIKVHTLKPGSTAYMYMVELKR